MELDNPAASPSATPETAPAESGTQATTPTQAAPATPAPGSPEALAKRFADASNPNAAAPAAAKPPEAAPAASGAPELPALIDSLAKQGKPHTFTAEGKEHQVKSADHLNQLLSQGVKFGGVSRKLAATEKEYGDFKAQTEAEYGPWNQRIKDDPQFAELTDWSFNDPRVSGFLHRVMTGQTSPEEKEFLSKGARFVDSNAIENAKLKRQVAETNAEKEQRTKQETEAQKAQAEHNDLVEIEKLGFVLFSDEAKEQPTPEGRALYKQLSEMVANGEAKSMLAAFKLTDHYANLIRTSEKRAADAKAKAEADERKKRQSAIRDAEGAGGGTAKPPQTTEKGSPANLVARFRAAQAASLR